LLLLRIRNVFTTNSRQSRAHTDKQRQAQTVLHISRYTEIFQYKLLSVVVHKMSHKVASWKQKRAITTKAEHVIHR